MTDDTTDVDTTNDVMEATEVASTCRQSVEEAVCAPLDGETAPYLVHGVAIGAGDVTMGPGGAKVWPAEELERAAGTLEDVPLNKNHNDTDVDAVIGKVTDAGYRDGVGVVFEAEVDDEDIATMIHRDRLDVSIHATHGVDGHDDDGRMIVEDIRFLDLSVVPRGAAPSNEVEQGASETLASLDTEDAATLITETLSTTASSDDDAHTADEPSVTDAASTDGTMTESTTELTDEADDIEADPESETEANAEPDIDDDVEQEAEAEESVETEESVEADADEVEAEEAETDAEDSPDEPAIVAELREEVAELREENERLRGEVESVRLEYAEALATDSVFETAELAEKFSLEELKDKYQECDEASLGGRPAVESDTASESDESEPDTESVASGTPAPQTGGESVPDQETQSERAELEQKIEQYREMGWDGAVEHYEDRLADLT